MNDNQTSLIIHAAMAVLSALLYAFGGDSGAEAAKVLGGGAAFGLFTPGLKRG